MVSKVLSKGFLTALVLAAFMGPTQSLGATAPIIGLSPRTDYSTICLKEPAPQLTYDWATWPGGSPPMELGLMYADALGYEAGTANVPRDPILAQRMLAYLASTTWERQGDSTYQLGRTYLDKSSAGYDPQVAVRLLNAAVDLGSSSAATFVGKLLLDGKEVTADAGAAKRYLLIGAAGGNIDAILSLAQLYIDRPDLQDSPTGAADYLKLAVLTITTEVARGHCTAMSYLGDIYGTDEFGLYDPVAAVSWYEAALGTGDLDAVLPLAGFYRSGEGVQPDAAKAISLLTMAANSGETSAMADLGEMLLETHDPSRAPEGINWLKRAADNLDPRGFELLSDVAAGVYGQTPDPVAAFEYLNRAASFPGASADIILRLAAAYMTGTGTTADSGQAYALYRRAASLGDPSAYVAMFDLSEGTPVPDSTNPILFLRTAANLGDGEAMNRLSDTYACGDGVARNLDTSRLWLERAASVGSSAAMRKLALAAQASGNPDEYIHLLHRAAQHRDPDAMVLLGWSYLHGIGVPADSAAGQQWIDAALTDDATKIRGSVALARLVESGAADAPPNKEQARQYLIAADASGNAAAMYELGKLYGDVGASGDDLDTARKYFVHAAQLGHVAAMLRLADLHVTAEQGGGKDWTAWLNQAVGTGNIRAIVMRSELATNLTERHGLFDAALHRNICDGKDLVTLAVALQDDPGYADKIPGLLQRAISIGTDDGGALFHLGQMIQQGLAGPNFTSHGIEYLKAAAQAGKAEAAREVGRIYLGLSGGPNYAEASSWLLKAAQAGDSDAIEDLASLVSDERMPPQNVGSIIDALETSVDKGSPEGLIALAKFYGELANVDQRYATKANELLEDAAARGNGDAMLQLADHYSQGIGVAKSVDVSTEWLRRAAELGYPAAFARYAIALQLGIGVKADPEQARTWLERATATSSTSGED